MKQLLLFCSGVNHEILRHCPTEEGKYIGLGAVVLGTAAMAALSSGFAVHMAFPSAPVLVALAYGLFWGALVFNLDRWIIASSRRHSNIKAEWKAALPRIALALLFGLVISEPLILQFFAPEINRQLAQNRAAARAIAQSKADANPMYQEIDRLRAANGSLRREIAEQRKVRNGYYQDYLDEGDGIRGTRIAGKGPAFREKGERLQQAQEEFKAVEQEKGAEIRENERRLARLQQHKDAEMQLLDGAEANATGLLARMHALHQLTAVDPLLMLAHWVLALFIMAVDCLPVLTKLLQAGSKYRPYDEVMEAQEEEAYQAARLMVEEGKIRTDTDVAVMKAHYHALEQQQMSNATEYARQVGEVSRQLNQEICDAWKAQAQAHIHQNMAQYVGPIGTSGAASGTLPPRGRPATGWASGAGKP